MVVTPEELRYQERGKPGKVDFPLSQEYESIEFTVADGTANYNVSTQESAAFKTFKSWTSCVIRTDKQITLRLNTTAKDAITIRKYESPFHLKTDIEINNIFITNNSGSTANIKILAFNRMYGHD